MELYSQILEHAGPAFGVVLRHIRDRSSEGCVFHCTAGKDRTGVLAAIILKVSYWLSLLALGLMNLACRRG
jgi:protein tyrosine/serine phosphatase